MQGILTDFFKGKKTIRVQGFEVQKLLTQCLSRGIALCNIKICSDTEIELQMTKRDFKIFKDITKKKYKISEINDSGFPFTLIRLWNRKSFIAGIFIFVFLVYYQSLFISEIKIIGCEKIDESIIRAKLSEAGFYEGCRKSEDIDKVKAYIYSNVNNIGWIGINFKGNEAVVEIVESEVPPEIVNINTPCDIRAVKSGYIYKMVTKYGVAVVQEGAFVKKGDVLISGMITKPEEAQGEQSENKENEELPDIKYIHSLGEVYGRIIYRYVFYEEKNEIKKTETGKNIFGLDMNIGGFDFNTAKLLLNYNAYISDDYPIINLIKPIPIKLQLMNYKEVTVESCKRDNKVINADVQKRIRQNINSDIGKKAQIINKDLKFAEEKNIIKVTVMLETIEPIGEERKITPVY